MNAELQTIDPAEAISLARTALSDPAGLDVGDDFAAVHRAGGMTGYAIDRLDDALRILRDDHEPDELRAALTYHGQRLAALADELRQESGDDPQRWAANRIEDGLDAVDEAIEALAEGDD